MRDTQQNLNGIWGYQISCRDTELREVYIVYTRQYVWLPAKLAGDKVFMDMFCRRAISSNTVIAFSNVFQLGYSSLPVLHYLPGMETFLRRLQNGARAFNNLYIGRCPHPECRRSVTNQDSGHCCLAIGGKFTDHHLGRIDGIDGYKPNHRTPC